VVGADSILADGGILNKAGTALLARAAQSHAIPLYVLAETLKIAPRTSSGDLAQLEEKSPQEVCPDAPPGVEARDIYFHHTPAGLVTAISSEQGLLTKEKIGQHAAEIQRTLDLF